MVSTVLVTGTGTCAERYQHMFQKDLRTGAMRCRRRHCAARIMGLLCLLGCITLVLFMQQIWDTRARDHETIKRDTDVLNRLQINQINSTQSGFWGFNQSLAKDKNEETLRKVKPYRYLLNEPDKCRKNDTFLVLLIPVEPYNSKARDAIRKTWGNESIVEGMVRLFFMGMQNKSTVLHHRTLKEESQLHRDIIQQEYIDSYYNLTIKTLMGMQWVSRYCPSTKYVMKADGDMFVNPEYLVKNLLKTNIPREKYFTGYLMRGYKPNRNKDSKWYMPHELYPSESYPTFCSGTGYVFSGDMAARIYTTSLSIHRLHLEDVYVGLCLSKLNIDPMQPPKEFMFNHWKVSYSLCKYSQLITSHGFQPSELLSYWKQLQENKEHACKRQGSASQGNVNE